MTMTYSPYSIPVFDALHKRFGDRFVVLSREPIESSSPEQFSHNYVAATKLGTFPRRFIKQWKVPLRLNSSHGRIQVGRVGVAPSLPRVLRSLDPALVVSPNFNTWGLTSLLMGYPTTLFWEGWSHTERTIGATRSRLRRWMASRATGLVAQGRLSKDYLVDSLGVPDDRIEVPGLCPQPAPEDLLEHSRRRRLSVTKPRFLCVARLVKGKGIDQLIRAAAQLERIAGADAAFEVVIVGEGPERARLSGLIDELDLRDRVKLAGYHSSSEIWRQYASADVFVLPTLQDYWSLSVAEAASMALPLLVSRFAGSVADLVDSSRNGYGFDPSDPQALAEIMLKYVRDPSIIPGHGERSLELIAPYTPERVADAIEAAMGQEMRDRLGSSRPLAAGAPQFSRRG